VNSNWQIDREKKYLAFNEEIIISARLNWVYGAMPLFRVAIVAVLVALAMSGSLGILIVPLAILAVQWLRQSGFAGRLGFVTVAAIVAAVWVTLQYALTDPARSIFIAGLIVIPILQGAFDYFFTRLYLTDKRIILRTGVLTERRSTLPLRALTDMRYDQTMFGRIFDYGHFAVESAGQDQALSQLRFVDAPRRFYRIVMHLALGGQLPRDAAEDIRPWE
jgi:hypothetical protein